MERRLTAGLPCLAVSMRLKSLGKSQKKFLAELQPLPHALCDRSKITSQLRGHKRVINRSARRKPTRLRKSISGTGLELVYT